MLKSTKKKIIITCKALGVLFFIWLFLFIYKSCTNHQEDLPSWQTVKNNFCQEYRENNNDVCNICPTPAPEVTPEPERTACDLPFSSAPTCSAWVTRCKAYCTDVVFTLCACNDCCASVCQRTGLCPQAGGSGAVGADCTRCTEEHGCVRLKRECDANADRRGDVCRSSI